MKNNILSIIMSGFNRFLISLLLLIMSITIIYYFLPNIHSSETLDTVDISNNDWLEDLFERRQIITIPSRKENVSLFCKSLEIKETIFNAILKKDLSYNNVYKLKPGEIACALSQEKVLREFVESGAKTLLMFEDDIMPITHQTYINSGITLEHVKKYVKKCVSYLPSTFDALYFGRCWDNCGKHIKINKFLVKVYRAMCHHAILFSRAGAQKILEGIKHPMSKPIDHIVADLCMKGEIDCYATSVPVWYQNRTELSTTIGNFDDLPICG